MSRGFEFRIEEVEGLHYLCSENKGADQLCSYRTADPFVFAYAKNRFPHDGTEFNNSATKSCSRTQLQRP